MTGSLTFEASTGQLALRPAYGGHGLTYWGQHRPPIQRYDGPLRFGAERVAGSQEEAAESRVFLSRLCESQARADEEQR